jgi:hypothetical protein
VSEATHAELDGRVRSFIALSQICLPHLLGSAPAQCERHRHISKGINLMKHLRFGTVSAIVLLTAASAAHADPTISYVPNSLKQSKIERGPWTLHETGKYFHHDASGIVPGSGLTPPYNPALSGTPCRLLQRGWPAHDQPR